MRTRDARRPSNPRIAGILANTVTLVVLSVLIFPLSIVLVMGSDGCRAPDEKLICTVEGQQLVAYLPPGSFLVAAAVGAAGGAAALIRRWRLLPWLLGPWIIPVAGTVTSFLIAGADSSEEFLQRQELERLEAERRWIEEILGRDDFEVASERYDGFFDDVATEVEQLVDGLDWPELHMSGVPGRLCGSDTGLRAYSGFDAGEADIVRESGLWNLSEGDWKAMERALRAVGHRYGFTGGPSRFRTTTGQVISRKLELSDLDGTEFSVGYGGFDRVSVRFYTPCYLAAGERARVAERQPRTSPTR